YDCFSSQDDVDNVLLPHLLNHHAGKLDYLFTSTPDSGAIKELRSEFNPKLISFSGNDSGQGTIPLTYLASTTYSAQSNFPANIKVFWKKSDNKKGYEGLLPALVVGNGTIILADWTGA
ncbi:MAG TPA: hypothetical protein DEO84_09515, partial [candidate division Zixibacteria bacterium]|nr:hypothetical protein [candidate division Zixibacteria bacterium]